MASHDDPNLGFATRAIHAGQVPDATTGAVMTPIYYTSTYAQSAPGVMISRKETTQKPATILISIVLKTPAVRQTLRKRISLTLRNSLSMLCS